MKLKTRSNQNTLGIAILLALASSAVIAGPVGTLTNFTAGTQAKAAEANGNFTTVSAAVNDNNARISTLETTVTGGNIVLAPSTAGAGNIMKGASRFLHNFGNGNTFLGENAGNFTMTPSSVVSINNTGIGYNALKSITSGSSNTASGNGALFSNTYGDGNTASGANALNNNTSGNRNTATGVSALGLNTTGYYNTASGFLALTSNTTGIENLASGVAALHSNTIGSQNTASGRGALQGNTTGNNNIGIGFNAGSALTTGSNNIAIGHVGQAGNMGTIRIGTPGVATNTFIAGISGVGVTGVAVLVDSAGQLGVATSSQRFKDDIADMGEASSTLMKLRPVTFHYKSDQNPKGRSLQYGLIAEEVEKVAPGLVARSASGEIETVFYQHLTPMLLNEYQKQQRLIETQTAALAKQNERVAVLEKQAQEIVALRQELTRMAAVLARVGQLEKVASTSH